MSAITPHLPSPQPRVAAPQEPLRKQLLALKAVAKRVEIEVLSQDNKHVLRRFRFVPPNDAKTGRKTRFTDIGVDHVLENFVDSFERDNPNHKYRLVVCKGKYRLVWAPEPEPEPDPVKKHLDEVMAAVKTGLLPQPASLSGPHVCPHCGNRSGYSRDAMIGQCLSCGKDAANAAVPA